MTLNQRQQLDLHIMKWHADAACHTPAPGELRSLPCVVTLSHDLGSGGAALAARVGDQHGLPVYDRQIVRHIATDARVQERTVEALEVQVRNRVEEYVGSLLRESNFDRGDYLRHLARTVTALWQQGPCVLVGHGSVHLVDRDHNLAVLVTGGVEQRARRVAVRYRTGLDRARRRVARADAERAAFHRRYFGISANAAENYDLIVNTDELEVIDAALLVTGAYRLRFCTAARAGHGERETSVLQEVPCI